MNNFWQKVNKRVILIEGGARGWIRRLAKKVDLDERELANKIRKNTKPNVQDAVRIARALGTTVEQLVGGSDVLVKETPSPHVTDYSSSGANAPAPAYLDEISDEWVDFPAYEVSAGQPILSDIGNVDIFCVHVTELGKTITPHNHGVVHVRGTSMVSAGIKNGCCALIRYHPEPVDGAVMAVFLGAQEGVTLKRVKQVAEAWCAFWEDGSGKSLKIGDDPQDKIIGLYVRTLKRVRLC